MYNTTNFQTIAQGNKAEAQGNKTEDQGIKSEAQGNKSEAQGNKSEAQGNKANIASTTIDSKIATKVDKTTLFEADSKLIRQDVIDPRQGMAKSMKDYGKANPFTSVVSFDISGDYSVESYFNSGSLQSPVDGSDYLVGFLRSGLVYIYNNTNLTFAYALQGGSQTPAILRTKKNTNYHFIAIRRDGVSEMYANGVLIGRKEFANVSEANRPISINNTNHASGSALVIYHTRVFNYALSTEEVLKLYNGGRPDKYEIGNELRGVSSNITIPFNDITVSSVGGSVATQEYVNNKAILKCTKAVGQYPAITSSVSIIVNPNDKRKLCKIKSKFKVISGTFSYGKFGGNVSDDGVSLLYTQGEYEVESDWLKCGYKNQHNLFSLRTSQDVFEVEFEYFDVSFKECIAEYLPSSLTPTSWRDTSGQVNDLSVTTPVELDYSEPSHERIEGDVPPTIVPDFKGQIFADNTAKVSYEAWGTTSAADWKQR